MKIVFLDKATIGNADFSAMISTYDVSFYDLTSKNDVKDRIKDADIVITNKVVLDADAIKSAQNLKLICVAATGFNNVDINYCKENNIAVTNVKGYSTPAVVGHTFALAFTLIHKIPQYNSFVLDGEYEKSPHFSCFDYEWGDIDGKTWGIIGFGTIGQGVAKAASAFGANVIYYSVSGKNESKDCKSVDLKTLLSTSDIISIHCPLSDLTKNLLNEERLGLLKKDTIVVNVARGGIVDESAMAKLINSNKIGGYASDVFEFEPINKDNPLLNCNKNKIVLTPHIAWASEQSRAKLLAQILENIKAFFDGKTLNRVA